MSLCGLVLSILSLIGLTTLPVELAALHEATDSSTETETERDVHLLLLLGHVDGVDLRGAEAGGHGLELVIQLSFVGLHPPLDLPLLESVSRGVKFRRREELLGDVDRPELRLDQGGAGVDVDESLTLVEDGQEELVMKIDDILGQ